MSELSLLELDVLPPKASIEAQFHTDDPSRVRFVARRNLDTDHPEESEPSGWFSLADAPIKLTWSTFWP